jgi:hypothetical protein
MALGRVEAVGIDLSAEGIRADQSGLRMLGFRRQDRRFPVMSGDWDREVM